MLKITDRDVRGVDLVDTQVLHSVLYQLRGQLLYPHERDYLREELIRSLLGLQDTVSWFATEIGINLDEERKTRTNKEKISDKS